MINPHNFDDDDFELEDQDFTPPKTVSQMTDGEKLQRFKNFFDSSSRALLQDCLFRIVNHEDGTGTLEILCPNEIVRQRLAKKKHKILNNIYGCWSHIKKFSLGIKQQNGELHLQTFNRSGEIQKS
ncbi:MAG TPA: hypothetical protein VK203_00545 [Nostocaceae cyanobacterium]|nr:hypothetical protein [Nostocaceae cyanobacterium]